MLNSNLPSSQLQRSLSDYLDKVDFILHELGVEGQIVQDKDMMGLLHHALNISRYANSSFRENLLLFAKLDDVTAFLDMVGIRYEAGSRASILESIKKASLLPWGNNDATKKFVDVFGYGRDLVPTVFAKRDAIKVILKPENPFKPLTDYQSKIFFKVANTISNSWARLVIHVPTGGGKTRTAMEIVSDFLNAGLNDNEERQVVWIADKDELCEQAIDALEGVWPHVGKKDLTLYRLWGNNRINSFDDFSFIVATYAKLNSLKKAKGALPRPHLIICDEAHNVIAPTHKASIRSLEDRDTRIIGLTATPIRGLDSTENRELYEFFNDTIIDIDSGDVNAIEYLQRRRYLANFDAVTIASNRVYRMSEAQRRMYAEDRDLPQGFLDEIARDRYRNAIIAEHLKALMETGKQVLYFAPNVEQSKLMCAIMIAMGAKAAHVDGNTPSEYRREVVARFRRNEINFIFNFDVFSTGFDAPNIDVVFIARPTNSVVRHQQMIGRGLRGPKMGGTEHCTIYRVSDDMPGIAVADEYFTDVWGS